MKRTILALGLCALLAGVACSKSTSNSIVVVTVTADSSMTAVYQLRAVLTNAGTVDTEMFPQTATGTPIGFDTTFAVTLPRSRSGQLDVVIEALDAATKVVASGEKSVPIVVGGRANVTIQLSDGVTRDAGVPDVRIPDALGGGLEAASDTFPTLDISGAVDTPSAIDGSIGLDVGSNSDALDAGGSPCIVNGVTYQPGQSFTINCVTYTCVNGPNLASKGGPCSDAPVLDLGVDGGDGGLDAPVIGVEAGDSGLGGVEVASSSICGNAKVEQQEACDDGNTLSGDGCSSTCRLETGFDCPTPGQPCIKAGCGNGKAENSEACDCGNDPNNLPNGCKAVNGLFYGDGQGCSKTCTREPHCQDSNGKTRACDAVCGDGNLDPSEGCDDGNLSDGDGCSSTCIVENGFTCSTQTFQDSSTCQSGSGQCLELPMIYRDFQGQNVSGGHPDFLWLGTKDGSGNITAWCQTDSGGPAKGADSTARCWGGVADTLSKGKPQPGTTTTCTCQFSDWSTNSASGSHVPGGYAQSDSPLSASGGFRTGATLNSYGVPVWNGLVPFYKNSASFQQWFNDDSTVNKTFTSALEMSPIGSGVYQYTSKAYKLGGGFFPLDSLNLPQKTGCNMWPYWNAKFFPGCTGDQWLSPPVIVDGDCGAGNPIAGGCWLTNLTGQTHDYYFSHESRYYFSYDGTSGLSLQFLANYDLFVFINGTLVVDLGGMHRDLPGKVVVAGNPGDAQVTEGGCLDVAGNITGTTVGSLACLPPGNTSPTSQTPDDFRTRTVGLSLVSGKTYEIAVFGANRAPVGSNFQMTLNGFTTKRSSCVPSP